MNRKKNNEIAKLPGKVKPKIGRPTSLTPETSARICDAYEKTGLKTEAARAGGVDDSTLFAWLEKASRGEEPYQDFSKALARAENAFKARMLNVVLEASVADWRAAGWILERKFPEEFGRPSKRGDEKPDQIVITVQRWGGPADGNVIDVTPKAKELPPDSDPAHNPAKL